MAGSDLHNSDSKVTADQPYRIASVTKTFVAVAILRLHEQGKLSIEDPISKYISEEHIDILTTGGYNTDSILIRHCLNHTSGLFDYAVGNPSYINIALKDPNKRWTRTEQLIGAMTWGSKQGSPGEKYHYSDTGYILLGETIEKLHNENLGLSLRELLNYEKLGLNSTWLESIEPAPENMPKQVRRYFKRKDYTDWDNSIDLYGGGGLVSTSKDIGRFYYSLFNHQVFEKKETLELMLSKPSYCDSYEFIEDDKHKYYHYGVYSFEVFGDTIYAHSGFWGTHIGHFPSYNTTFAFNYTDGRNEYYMKKIYRTMKNFAASKN